MLPPTAAEADYRLRIFTPQAELPFAGHPTVSQGARVGRAASIDIAADPDGTVRVGGATTVCVRGTITV